MNTQIKKAPTGKTYEVSTSFKIGDKVAIHNKITGEISYTGFIKFYTKGGIYTGHYATIQTEEGITENSLASALIIN